MGKGGVEGGGLGWKGKSKLGEKKRKNSRKSNETRKTFLERHHQTELTARNHFYRMEMGFYRVLPSFTEFYRV